MYPDASIWAVHDDQIWRVTLPSAVSGTAIEPPPRLLRMRACILGKGNCGAAHDEQKGNVSIARPDCRTSPLTQRQNIVDALT